MWFKLDSGRISGSQCVHSGLMLKRHQVLVKIKQSNAFFDWIQLPRFHQHNQEIVRVTQRLIVLLQLIG